MLFLGAHVTGAVPRSPALIAATRGFDRGRVLEQELRAQEAEDTRDAIALQIASGCAPVSNPQLNWQDLFRPFVPALTGVKTGALTRWFNNNTFYRQPVVTDTVEFKGGLEDRFLMRDHLPDEGSWKTSLPGPWTFVTLSADHYYGDAADLLRDFGDAMGRCARELASLGFDHLQFCDPSLVVQPPEDGGWDLVADAYTRACGGVEGTTSIHTCFGDVAPVLDRLLDLPADVVGADLFATDLPSLRAVDVDKAIALGCVDARNSLVESPEDVLGFATRAVEALDPPAVALTTNCDLEFLTRAIAGEKVTALGEAAARLREVA